MKTQELLLMSRESPICRLLLAFYPVFIVGSQRELSISFIFD